MTTSDLIQRYRDLLAYDLDGLLGVQPDDASVAKVLNDAQDELGRECFLVNPAVAMTTTIGVSTYGLQDTTVFSRRIVTPFQVNYNGSLLRRCDTHGYGLWTLKELNSRQPTWRAAANGTPLRAALVPETSLILNPPPSAVVAVTIEAQVLPLPLDSTTPTVVPELPAELHMEIARRAAYLSCYSFAQTDAQFKKLETMGMESLAKSRAIGDMRRIAYGVAPLNKQ